MSCLIDVSINITISHTLHSPQYTNSCYISQLWKDLVVDIYPSAYLSWAQLLH